VKSCKAKVAGGEIFCSDVMLSNSVEFIVSEDRSFYVHKIMVLFCCFLISAAVKLKL